MSEKIQVKELITKATKGSSNVLEQGTVASGRKCFTKLLVNATTDKPLETRHIKGMLSNEVH